MMLFDLIMMHCLWLMNWIVLFINAELDDITTQKLYELTIDQFIQNNKYSDAFKEYYLIPMTSSIWSTPKSEMLEFPILTLIM